jgi:hypothetical protein
LSNGDIQRCNRHQHRKAGVDVQLLEPRVLLAGVTIITHGFWSDASEAGWMDSMARAIAERGEGIDATVYRVVLTDGGNSSNPVEVDTLSTQLLRGPFPTGSTLGPAPNNPEIFILLDWSTMAGEFRWDPRTWLGGHHRSTVDVAQAIVPRLLDGNLGLLGLTTPLAQMPFHLIGHSRGGSLVAEMAYLLGKRGVWVDQVTTLDPHPVDGVNEPADIDLLLRWGDSTPKRWSNVAFFDNY